MAKWEHIEVESSGVVLVFEIKPKDSESVSALIDQVRFCINRNSPGATLRFAECAYGASVKIKRGWISRVLARLFAAKRG